MPAGLTDCDPDSNYLHVRNIRKTTPPIEANQSDFVSRCRERGVRLTAQRLAVFNALAGDAMHPTADSLYAALRETMPSLSLSTVYRILESLEAEGLVRRVSTVAGIARYDGNVTPHQHLVCRICGRMTDVARQSFSGLRVRGLHFAGFIAEELDIRIVGTCLECRPASGSDPKIQSSKARRKADG
jgi:Fur family transcriptional regulator, peroxide stress response regulator